MYLTMSRPPLVVMSPLVVDSPFRLRPFRLNPLRLRPFSARPFRLSPLRLRPLSARPFRLRPFSDWAAARPSWSAPSVCSPHPTIPTMAPSDSPTVRPTLIVRFPRAFMVSPLCGSPADSVSPVGFASPDRSRFAVFTRPLLPTRTYKAVIEPTFFIPIVPGIRHFMRAAGGSLLPREQRTMYGEQRDESGLPGPIGGCSPRLRSVPGRVSSRRRRPKRKRPTRGKRAGRRLARELAGSNYQVLKVA